MPNLELTQIILVYCNIVNNDCLQDSRVLYTSIPNKLFGQLRDSFPKNLQKILIQNVNTLKYGLLIKVIKLQK